jgi:uncharacterized damage-inducible protein DinB
MKLFITGLRIIAIAGLLSTALFAQQSAPAASTPKSIGDILNQQLSMIEKNVTSLAEAIPENKYGFVPAGPEFKTSRNLGTQFKHIATANYMLGAGITGEAKPIDTKGPDGPENIKTKAEIAKFLQDSYEYLHKALSSMNDKNVNQPMKNPFGMKEDWSKLDMATLVIAHNYDHYGQAVVYSRLNDIVPPGSRPQK